MSFEANSKIFQVPFCNNDVSINEATGDVGQTYIHILIHTIFSSKERISRLVISNLWGKK